MLRDLLLILNMLVCLALIGVVLLQRSEGGALGTGGSPTGLVTARGAGDLLTKTTWVLFSAFLLISLGLTLLGGHDRSSAAILNRLKNQTINPAALAARLAPPPAQNAPAANAPTPSTPGEATPTPIQLPPLSTTPARSAANPVGARRTATPARPAPVKSLSSIGTPAPLQLPPLTGERTARPAAPAANVPILKPPPLNAPISTAPTPPANAPQP